MRPAVPLLLVALAASGCLVPWDDDASAALRTSQPAAYLWSDPYPDLLLEFDHVEGAAPSQFAVDALLAMLQEETSKRKITVAPYEEMPRFTTANSGKRWTLDELRELAHETLDHAPPGAYGQGDTAVLHILYLDGEYSEEGQGVRGLALGATAILFQNPRAGSVLGPSAPSTDLPPVMKPLMERRVLIHEVGHVLGLVDRLIPMVRPHNDPEDPAHSRNPESVMHVGVDLSTTYLGQVDPDSEAPYKFDDDDKADLRAFRERQPPARP